jgi:regulator of protease activity HflC (stomatin/prohibitin superfamily)
MNKQKMIEWIATCDTGISSKTMWSALMGVKRKKDLNIPKDNSDFRRCYDMVEYGHVTLDELQVVKKQYPWFAPVVDNWKELSLLFEEELDKRLYMRIRQLCEESDIIRYEKRGELYYERNFWYNITIIKLRMKKIILMFCIAILGMSALTSCHSVSPDADEEAVIVKKPWFIGHGGVEQQAVQTGLTWCWWSTSGYYFKIVPVRHEITLDDLFSDDNTPLDFHTVIITQIEQGKSPILLQNYGEKWFDTNLNNYFCNLVRDHISQHSPFDLMSNRQVLNQIDTKIRKQMQDYVNALSKKKQMPIIIKEVIIGKATPNKEQLNEMNRTAKVVQAKQTQEREYEVQIAREKAERQKAKADKAYMEEMNLSAGQFINLKWIETVANKQGANIDVMVGPAESMWNIRRN